MKFGRQYRLTIQKQDGTYLTLQLPLTIKFNITRGIMAALNQMQIRIYNLGENNRNQIFQDWYNPREYKQIILQAGYNELSTIFQGNIFQAFSYKEGVNIVTYCDCRDGGFDYSNTRTSRTVQKDTDIADVVRMLGNSFAHLKLGNVGQIDGTFQRPVVLEGNTLDLIRKYTGNDVFIDLEKLYVLKNGEYISGAVTLINSDTGLLGTPVRSDAYLSVPTVFEPRVILGQLVEIQAEINKAYNGQYKVVGVGHMGTISAVEAGQCNTSLSLLIGTAITGGFTAVQ